MFPIFGVIILLVVYVIFDQAIIHCGGKYVPLGCSAIDAVGVFGSTAKPEEKTFDILRGNMETADAEYKKQDARVLTSETTEQKTDHTALVLKLKTKRDNIRQEMASRYHTG